MDAFPQELGSSVDSDRNEFITAFVAKSVEAANALYDQYYQSVHAAKTPTSALGSLGGPQETVLGSDSLVSLLATTPIGTPAGTPIFRPATLPSRTLSPPPSFAFPPQDRISSNVGLGLFASPHTLVPSTTGNTYSTTTSANATTAAMNFNEAEAILSSPLCSPLLGPSHTISSPYLQRRLSSFMPKRPSAGPGPGSRKQSNASTAATYFPQPESRASSLSSSFGLDLNHDAFNSIQQQQQVQNIVQQKQHLHQHQPHHHVFQPHPLAFTALTPSLLALSPETAISPASTESSNKWSTATTSTVRMSPEISFDAPSCAPTTTTTTTSTTASVKHELVIPPGSVSPDSKKRTRLTAAQREYMMEIFKQDQNPPSKVIRQVSETVGMNFRLVQYWYQNRRAALRRKQAAGRSDADDADD